MRSKRISGAAAVLLVGSALSLTTACSGSNPAKPDAGGSPAATAPDAPAPGTAAPAAKASKAALSVQPADGATGVAPTSPVKVSVADGKLTQVTVTGPDGKPVAGTVGPDGNWAPAAALAVSAKYQVSAQAVDASGAATTTTSSFTTLTPKKTESVKDNLTDQKQYGVGMIISVTFDQPVKDKKAAEQAVKVVASDGTTVRGHWFDGDTRLDIRPEKYWTPGTTVTVTRRVSNVELSPGVYGAKDVDESFTIGRSKISTADAAAHMMTVVENGVTLPPIKITAGSDENPSWNGTMVVFDKEPMVHMVSSTTTIKGQPYDVWEPHGLQITATGSYVHGNPKAAAVAGLSNISHGCIGLPDSEKGDDNSVAGKFYQDSMIGDVVIIKNSVGEQVDPANGLSGWSLPWAQW
ncbi:L,D-transpeptidase [Kitasatospora viridis]|uniref:L,D-TPase catalytic domain-containing protein n=1 Tax=Kitasatospora viridis TaxID=281105 RepID=A0A561SE52_9ACTN|nr:Ig-like domain-containing protein [Kitasatospora viridis]TWF73131.1 hypothetical protein FHX73_16282 [Kitasatospora viridis]